MFFFIGGIQPKTVRLEKHSRACPSCAHFELYTERIDQYIALFFIPLIRIRKGMPFTTCRHCNTVWDDPPGSTGYESNQGSVAQTCGFCGKNVESNFAYCPFCGRAL
jgi:hypothetical protein